MAITIKENSRFGPSVLIDVLDAQSKVIYTRYVDGAKFDSDPLAEAAKIADYLAKIPPVLIIVPTVKSPVTYTDKQISDKLALINAGK